MRIYRPADVVAMADQIRSNLAESADQAGKLVELVPRVLAMVRRAEFLLDSAERTMLRAEDLVGRGEALIEGLEEVAPTALPVLGEVFDAIDPSEVRAMNGLIDGLPELKEQMHHLAPDVHRILDAITDLSQALKGVPGVNTLIRRGERKEEEEALEQLSADLAAPARVSPGPTGYESDHAR